jgi:multicomponent Na+:H+ antiporter subunit A
MRPRLEPSLILDTVTRAAFPPVLVFAFYLLFVGHNAPGGGFVSGLTFGISYVLLYAGGGLQRVASVVPVGYEVLLGAGLLLAGGTGLASLVLGEPFLSSAILEAQVPVLGEIKLVTVLFFDTGVALVVVGLVLALATVLGHFGDRIASGDDERDPTAVDADELEGGARPYQEQGTPAKVVR